MSRRWDSDCCARWARSWWRRRGHWSDAPSSSTVCGTCIFRFSSSKRTRAGWRTWQLAWVCPRRAQSSSRAGSRACLATSCKARGPVRRVGRTMLALGSPVTSRAHRTLLNNYFFFTIIRYLLSHNRSYLFNLFLILLKFFIIYIYFFNYNHLPKVACEPKSLRQVVADPERAQEWTCARASS